MSAPVPPLSTLEALAKEVVWDALRNGTVKDLTPRIVRQKIESQLDLEAGCLDVAPYKHDLKDVIKAAAKGPPPPAAQEMEVDSQRDDDIKEREDSPQPSSAKRKRSSATRAIIEDSDADEQQEEKPVMRSSPVPSPKVKPQPKKRFSRVVESEDEQDSDKDGSSDKEEGNSSKRRRVSSELDDSDKIKIGPPKKSAQRAKPAKSALKSSNKAVKTPEHVPTSDVEQDEPGPSSHNPPSSASSSKENYDATNDAKTTSRAQKHTMSEAVDNESDRETEAGDLIDESPKKNGKTKKAAAAPKSKSSKTPATEKKKRATKGSATPLTKDEETIKRLKSLVVACGVRKVWSKVFQNIDSPSQQIKMLKEILHDLGMSGRMSMEQAKAIKAKREFEEELAEVQQFEKNMRARESKGVKKGRKAESDAEEDHQPASEDEEEAPVPRRRRLNNARASIAAFLDDQSEEE